MWRRMRGGAAVPPKDAKQGTGPSSMALVVIISMALAIAAGFVLYFTFFNPMAPPPAP